MLITVSGTDGSGKTSACDSLRDILHCQGVKVARTKNPSPQYFTNRFVDAFRTTGDAGIRTEVMGLLSAYDRLVQYETEFRTHLDAGFVLISDRYKMDGVGNFVYRGVDLNWLLTLNRYAPEPDIAVWLKCPPQVAMERIIARGEAIAWDERNVGVIGAKFDAYAKVAATVPTITVVDANRSREAIVQDLYELVFERWTAWARNHPEQPSVLATWANVQSLLKDEAS